MGRTTKVWTTKVWTTRVEIRNETLVNNVQEYLLNNVQFVCVESI